MAVTLLAPSLLAAACSMLLLPAAVTAAALLQSAVCADLWVLELDECKALAHAIRALGHEDAT